MTIEFYDDDGSFLYTVHLKDNINVDDLIGKIEQFVEKEDLFKKEDK